jgi:hypothetical protein
VPIRKPKIVARNVKAMSVQASPSVKKIFSVLMIALGLDQKKASIIPVSAATCQNATAATRMPICAARIAHPGQSFCIGRRRIGRAGAAAGAGAACAALTAGMRATGVS